MFEAVETWDITIYFVFIGILLFFGKVIKEKVPFLNRIILVLGRGQSETMPNCGVEGR